MTFCEHKVLRTEFVETYRFNDGNKEIETEDLNPYHMDTINIC